MVYANGNVQIWFFILKKKLLKFFYIHRTWYTGYSTILVLFRSDIKLTQNYRRVCKKKKLDYKI